MTDQEFIQWGVGVLDGIHAPVNYINEDSLTAWSNAEGGRSHNNPLNTTWFMPGAIPWNTLPSGEHVWIYATVQDAITATVLTLTTPDPSVGLPNGYDAIVYALRNSIPYQDWGFCCGQLDKWGTGCNWIHSGDDMNSTDVKGVILAAVHGTGQGLVVTQAQVDAWAAEYPAKPLDVIISSIVNTPLALENKPPKPGPQGPVGTVPAHDHGIAASTTEPFTP